VLPALSTSNSKAAAMPLRRDNRGELVV
jgi:hypothetical protein